MHEKMRAEAERRFEVRCPDLSNVPPLGEVDLQYVKHPEMAADPLPVHVWGSLRMAANYFQERCGFITSGYRLEFAENVHEDPAHNFLMNQDEIKRIIERVVSFNERIIGVFHTHPSGDPSPSTGDILGWPNRDLGWRYFIATTSDVHEWDFRNQPVHSSSYAGIPVQR